MFLSKTRNSHPIFRSLSCSSERPLEVFWISLRISSLPRDSIYSSFQNPASLCGQQFPSYKPLPFFYQFLFFWTSCLHVDFPKTSRDQFNTLEKHVVSTFLAPGKHEGSIRSFIYRASAEKSPPKFAKCEGRKWLSCFCSIQLQSARFGGSAYFSLKHDYCHLSTCKPSKLQVEACIDQLFLASENNENRVVCKFRVHLLVLETSTFDEEVKQIYFFFWQKSMKTRKKTTFFIRKKFSKAKFFSYKKCCFLPCFHVCFQKKK